MQYKLAATVHRYLLHWGPRYLTDYCVPVSKVLSRQHLRFVRRRQLSVPRVHRSMFESRTFSVTGQLWSLKFTPK